MRESLALRGNEFTKKQFRGKGVNLIPVRNIQLYTGLGQPVTEGK